MNKAKASKTVSPETPLTVLSLDAKPRKKLKIASANQERSMTAIIEELIEKHL